ncbi:MAG: BatA domain-containing protein [Planctomycetes bacterium]|nr:BatA domain-containing protein [Planctomycetota bacterium]
MSPFLHVELAWAAAALGAIPIIIHLINRRRLRRLDWAAMEFLLAALRKNRRRIRLEQLVLLACRILLMVLIAFFLARPMLSDQGFGWLASVLLSEDKVFVVDDSLSMAERQADRTLLERTTAALIDTLHRLAERSSRDRVTILRSSRPEAPIVRGSFVDRERAAALEQSLRALSPTSTRMDLGRVLESIAEHGAMVSSEGGQRPRTVSILTDLRAADWTDGSGGASASLQAAFERLAASAEVPTSLAILDAGSGSPGNVAVTGVEIAGGRPAAGIPSDVHVRITNHGREAVGDLRVRLSYAPTSQETGASMALAAPIPRLAGGESGVASVAVTFREAGQYRAAVEVSGAGDPLPEDNQRSFVVDVIEATEVLLVSGEPSSQLYEGETDYLETALRPSGETSSGLAPKVVVEDSLPGDALSRFGAIVLANVYLLPREFVPRLGAYVREGGTLLIFLGDQVDPVIYARDLGGAEGPADPEHPARDLLPAGIGELRAHEQLPVGMVPSFDHPFFRFLRDGGEALIAEAGFSRFFLLEPQPRARVIAQFDDADGSPAIVEREAGSGRVILFASSADAEWNDWPVSPTYLPVLQQIMETTGRAEADLAGHAAGSRIEIPVDITLYAKEARYRGPEYPETPERVLIAAPPPEGARAEEFRFRLDDTMKAGLSTLVLRKRDGGEEIRAFAVRSEPEESDLVRLAPEDLARLYPDLPLEVIRDAADVAAAGRGRFEISDLLIGLFLALLFAEGFLAWLFARHRRQSGLAPAGRAQGPPAQASARREGAAMAAGGTS